jgi:prefoldin subunit 5
MMKTYRRAEIEIARTELADAVRRLNRLEAELEEVRAVVKQLWMKILELEQVGST